MNGARSDEEKGGASSNLASVGMLVAPLIAALAGLALTGTIGRVQRDDPFWFSVAIGLVIAAGMLWVGAATFTEPKKDANRSTLDIVLRSLAVFCAGAGFILALAVAVATANNEPRPELTPTVSEDGTTLTTHVTASSLPTDHRLAFRVNLMKESKFVSSPYRSYVGPNSDGNIDQTVTIRLPAGSYDEIEIKAYTGTTSPSCDDFVEVLESATFGSGTGCVILAYSPPPKPKPMTKTAKREPRPKPPSPQPTTGGME